MTEPVAWMEIDKYLDENNLWESRVIFREYDTGLGVPLYTKREWVGLTDEDIEKLRGPFPLYASEWSDSDYVNFARAIAAKLKEKNS